MRISLNEIKQLEDWLLKRGDVEDRLITEAKVLTDTEWKANADYQRMAYQLVYQYGREKLQAEISAIEHRLFHESKYRSFQRRIRSIFK